MSDKLDVGLRDRLRSRQTEDFEGRSQLIRKARSPSRAADTDTDSDDEDDSLILIPDTPSPVFTKKLHPNLSKSRCVKYKHGLSNTCDPTPDSKSKALNELIGRRTKIKRKKTAEDPAENKKQDCDEKTRDSRSFGATGGATNSNHGDNPNLLDTDSEEEYLGLVEFDLGAEDRANAESGTTSSLSTISTADGQGSATAAPLCTKHQKTKIRAAPLCTDSDSTDIDEDDFDEFINKLRGHSREYELTDRSHDYNHGNLNKAESQLDANNGNQLDSLTGNQLDPVTETQAADVIKRKPSKSPVTHNNVSRKRSRVSSASDINAAGTSGAGDLQQHHNDTEDDISILASLDRLADNAGSPAVASTSWRSSRPTRTNLFDSFRVAPRLDGTLKSDTGPDSPGPSVSESWGEGPSGLSGSSQSAPCHPIQSTSMPGPPTAHVRALPTPPERPSHQSAATFVVPENVSPRRNGKTMTQTRVPGLRRRGNRTTRPTGGAAMSSSLLVSPASVANHQMAEDEVMARRLQEELDREFAMTLDNMASPTSAAHSLRTGTSPFGAMRQRLTGSGVGRNVGRLAAARRQMEESLDREVQMYLMLGQMSDEEWDSHQAVLRGAETPAEGAPEASTSTEGQGRRTTRSANERSPIRPSTRRPGVTTRGSSGVRTSSSSGTVPRRRQRLADWEYGNFLLGSPWEQAGAENNIQGALIDILDQGILTPDVGARVGTTRGRQRGRRARRVPRDLIGNSFNENDYEALLNLAETIGDAKPRGLSDHQINLLPTKTYLAAEVGEDGMKECSICFVEYTEGEELRLMQCFHYFHAECIDRWLKENSSCPICRVEVKFD